MKTRTNNILASILGVAMLVSCDNQENVSKEKTSSMSNPEKGTFQYDLDFLRAQDNNLVVLSSEDSNSQVIISSKYQGKVFTSTASGPGGRSFGWINYKAFNEPVNEHMNAYGGEDRLWLGPEGGKFSIYFKPGATMDFENWHTPKAIDTESWKLVSQDDQKVSLVKDMSLENYAGTDLKIKVQRDIEIISKDSMKQLFPINDTDKINIVGFNTINSITNAGTEAWDEQTGAPCLWSLDMLSPSDKCVIVIPYEENAKGKVATTDYFGEIPKDRVTYNDGVLMFRADGKSRGKLGIPPARAKDIAGSYDAENGILTITKFDINRKGKYLNQEWRTDRQPYSGDAMNAYNDGPLEDGSQMGPFYEIESVSPAAFLKPGEKLTHHHSVFHFTGDLAALDRIAKKMLGVSLDQIEKAFTK